MEAVRSFTQLKLQSNVEHTASCIVFSDNATIAFSHQTLAASLFDGISFTGGGTNFEHPLRMAIQLLKKCTVQSLTVIIFMTDGDAPFPSCEIDTLNTPEYERKIDTFWGVLFGSDSNGTLQRMADSMGDKGYFRNPTDLKGLVNDYIEIAKLS
jgi:uncharacterized protein with von Willebrand factor type A (vWA) domain